MKPFHIDPQWVYHAHHEAEHEGGLGVDLMELLPFAKEGDHSPAHLPVLVPPDRFDLVHEAIEVAQRLLDGGDYFMPGYAQALIDRGRQWLKEQWLEQQRVAPRPITGDEPEWGRRY